MPVGRRASGLRYHSGGSIRTFLGDYLAHGDDLVPRLEGSEPALPLGDHQVPRAGERLEPEELAKLNASFENADAAEVIRWANERYGSGLCVAVSMTDAVLIDLAVRVDPDVAVVFIDTGYHFPETMSTLETVQQRYHVNIQVVRLGAPLDNLWTRDPDACCAARKVRPFREALRGRAAWMSGIRRVQSPTRASAHFVERDRDGLVKINPLLRWTDEDVQRYVAEHDVPVNPLVRQGFPSIGCWPCTRVLEPGEDPRAGRWAGRGKSECGLHPDGNDAD